MERKYKKHSKHVWKIPIYCLYLLLEIKSNRAASLTLFLLIIYCMPVFQCLFLFFHKMFHKMYFFIKCCISTSYMLQTVLKIFYFLFNMFQYSNILQFLFYKWRFWEDAYRNAGGVSTWRHNFKTQITALLPLKITVKYTI